MSKKYVSSFVKKMNELKKRIKNILLWDSSKGQTYIKPKNGKSA